MCGDDCSFSDEAIADAIDVAEGEVWELVPEKDIHYFFSDEDWTKRNRVILKTLGITEMLDDLSGG